MCTFSIFNSLSFVPNGQGDQIGRTFYPIGSLFTLGSIFKITEAAQFFGTFPHDK
jgi:hypothetical protein